MALSSSAETRWRLSGKLPDGHAPLAAHATPRSRGAEQQAAAAARDLVVAAQHEDVSARLRALRSSSSSSSSSVTAAADPARHMQASRTSSGGGHVAWTPRASPLGSPRRYGAATSARVGSTLASGPSDNRAAAAADRHLKSLFEPASTRPSPTLTSVTSNYFVRPTTGTLANGRRAESEAGAEARSRGMPRGAAAEAALRELLYEVQSGGSHVDKVMMLNKHADRIVTLLES